jgi:hypothetical protein
MKFFSAQKLIALSLIIFLSGTCCLLCCEMMKVKAAGGESCPLSKGSHHCPKANKPETSQNVVEAAADTEKCCPFISKRGEIAKNADVDLTFAGASLVKVSEPIELPVDSAFAALKIYSSNVRDRGGTYLANCVFRI